MSPDDPTPPTDDATKVVSLDDARKSKGKKVKVVKGQAKAPAAAPSDPAQTKTGRPHKLQEDEQTLKLLRGLARIQCTNAEAAAVFEVARQTFEDFLGRSKKAADAFAFGREQGKMSLRRMQWNSAPRSITMQIWLGKQYLGQTDKVEEKVDSTIVQETTVTHNVSDAYRELTEKLGIGFRPAMPSNPNQPTKH